MDGCTERYLLIEVYNYGEKKRERVSGVHFSAERVRVCRKERGREGRERSETDYWLHVRTDGVEKRERESEREKEREHERGELGVHD